MRLLGERRSSRRRDFRLERDLMSLPCILHEDDNFLVVVKPAGVSTHAPSPYAGEGIYEFLRGREPRWASLAIIHRLDKETSGLLVFSKTTGASRSLTRQFESRRVRKRYLFETDRPAAFSAKEVESALVRSGDRYLARPTHAGGDTAVTRFHFLRETAPGCLLWQAEPLTGKTHQIRVHAAHLGIPIRGDALYGGAAGPRVCLHSAELGFTGMDGNPVLFRSEPHFEADARQVMRAAFIEPELTNAFRLVHGAADGRPGWYVDQYGDYLLSQAASPLQPAWEEWLRCKAGELGLRGVYHKTLSRNISPEAPAEVSPAPVFGEAAPVEFSIMENGIQFLTSFSTGYSVGLFLDQRENRRRWLAGALERGGAGRGIEGRRPEVLNTFAYTCGFSVCAAKAGARVTSLDLSRHYLDWGRRNFSANGLDPSDHDFIYGDVGDWLGRLEKKNRSFDAIILDPPTFSRSKEWGVFRVEHDLPRLLGIGLRLLRPAGLVFASSNSSQWQAEDFAEHLASAVKASGRKLKSLDYVAQPLDFPIHPREPAHLKSAWLRIE